ncbi:MAG: primosomal protein N' [Rubripirellula sp.]|nr:primosomal protein N' [Rubripirellula sp.]
MAKRNNERNAGDLRNLPREESDCPDFAAKGAEASHLPAHQGELFDLSPPPWEILDEGPITVATVVFSEAPYGPYDYSVGTSHRSLEPGMRVKVPLGNRRQPMLGWCTKVQTEANSNRKLRAISDVIDDQPLCDDSLVRLVLWMSHYYQAPAGQVFDTLIPSSVRSLAGTRETIYYSPGHDAKNAETINSLPVKQKAALLSLIRANQPLSTAQLMLDAQCSQDPIKRLLNKGLIHAESRRELSGQSLNRWRLDDGEAERKLQLTEDQRNALKRIVDAIDSDSQKTFLLHGVTGSGKTEVYIRAIEHVVRFGRGAIVLVPEISLTPQTRGRFERRFKSVAVLHSQMTPAERHFQWQRIRQGDVQVVVGPRSAVFAPFPRLGVIILDEEHDSSFKQDTQPRYHARKVAHARAKSLGIPLILGSATPSLESWQAADSGFADLISLSGRVNTLPMPDVQLVDLRLKEDRTNGAISRPLHQAIQATLKERGQIMLLLNRRGFATSIQCPACGHVVVCPDCDLSLTHHRDGSKAVCHYCDYTIGTPPWCPSCRFEGIRFGGLGTQKLEVEIQNRFPEARIARMDSDTMRKPGSHQKVLSNFRSGEIDILLGTQMIAKGLDFPNVLLVGVINADSALHFPDFRAAERTFQLVTQVAGRTGRGNRSGRVVVQTFTPEHPAIQAASRHDYLKFAKDELINRKRFHYPPFGNVARIIIRGPDEKMTEIVSQSIAKRLESARTTLGFEVRILGPAPPPLTRLRGKYRFHILLQSTNANQLGETIRVGTDQFKVPDNSEIQFVVDIDPIDML